MRFWLKENVDLLAVVLLGLMIAAADPVGRGPDILHLSLNPQCIGDVLEGQQPIEIVLPDFRF